MESIYQAINGIMKEIGAIGKNKHNDQQKYMYRGIDDIMTALSPVMQSHGVFVIPEVLEQVREEKEGRNSKLLYSIVKVRYTFQALDGSSVQAVVLGEGMDSGDKATNKAMSAAFKYALLQTFCIPTDEMIDSEQDSPEVKKQKQEVKPQQNAPRLSPQEVDMFTADLLQAGANIQKICQRYKVKDLGELTGDQANEIIAIVRGNGNNR